MEETVPKVRTYEPDQPLYRVDSKIVGTSDSNIRLSDIFTEDRPTYFLTNSANSKSYVKHYKGKNSSSDVYLRTFVPVEPLHLLDLNDVGTVQWLRDQVNDEERSSINTSFQIRTNGSIYRHSEGQTKIADDRSLRVICNLGQFDGYYVHAPGLHPEVGLCSSAFNKLKFVSQKIMISPNNMKSRKRKAPNWRANNGTINMKKNNNNNLFGPPSIKRLKWSLEGGKRRKTRKNRN